MVDYRRAQYGNPDDEYFLTLVTKDRAALFREHTHYNALWAALSDALKRADGTPIAWVFLPDHLHLLIRQGDRPFSTTIKVFKHLSNRALGQPSLWQPRFWEHRIRNDDDRLRCIAYIHYNPTRHGHTERPFDWPCSSLREFVRRAWEEEEWSAGPPDELPWQGGEPV